MVNRHRAVSMAFNGNVSRDDEEKTLKSLSELKSLYRDIRYDWAQLATGEISPIELAIAFLDDTSVGLAHRKAEFDDLCESASDALRNAVVENHEIFNNSVGLYHLLLEMARTSQQDSADIKRLMDTATRDVNDRSLYLKELDSTSAKYSEMLDILDAVEYLYKIPQTIDELVAGKKVYAVYDVISEGYKIAARYNLWALPALAATHGYLEMQSESLYDMIIDELRNEIYLRNSHVFSQSKDMWSTLLSSGTPQLASFKSLLDVLTNLELFIYNSANLDLLDIAACFTDYTSVFVNDHLPRIHAHYSKYDTATTNADYALILESSLSPAYQSCYYMYMLLSTASKLNRLHPVLEVLVSSLQQEMHDLINQATDECKHKNPHQLLRLLKARKLESAAFRDKISGQTFLDAAVPILQDFFGTFFLKAMAILANHRVVFEIVKLIELSQDIATTAPAARDPRARDSTSADGAVSSATATLVYDFETVWSLMRKELESIVVNYIHDDHLEDAVTMKGDRNTPANKLHHVLTMKQLFSFNDVSFEKTTKTTEDMTQVLNDMFPGFNLKSHSSSSANGSNAEASPYITSEQFNVLVEDLVPKNIYNMRIALEYLLIFVCGAQMMFSSSERIRGAKFSAYLFFNDFMRNVFLKRLRQELDIAFEETMTGEVHASLISEASAGIVEFKFGQETTSLHDEEISTGVHAPFGKPMSASARVYTNAVLFRRLFNNICHTMNTSYTYRKDLSDMVLSMLQKFARRYQDYYDEVLTGGTGHDITEMGLGLHERSKHVLRINKWMNTPAMAEMTGAVLQNHSSTDTCGPFLTKEMELIFFKTEAMPNVFDVSKDDFLDEESFHQVCHLLLSASWVLQWLPQMRKESNYSIYEPNGEKTSKVTEVEKLKHDWLFLENGRSNFSMSESQHVYLTLNLDRVGDFDMVVQTFETIRDKALVALRYDLRLKAMYYIGKSFQGDFVLSTEPADLDQYIGLLNKEVYSVGTRIDELLTAEEGECVFLGLPGFLTKAFIQGSEMIEVANRNGIKKILLNVITLQQMLRSMTKHRETVDFSKATRYFEMFTASEHVLLQKVASSTDGYTRDEVLNLLRLIYSEKLSSKTASSFNRSKYSELSKKIYDIFS